MQGGTTPIHLVGSIDDYNVCRGHWNAEKTERGTVPAGKPGAS
jgi:hypothetical protein